MSQPISSVRKFEIAPMNQSSGNATFSYVSGNPLVQFEIGAADMYLMSSKLRLNFRLQLTTGTNARPNNNDQDGTGNKEVLLNNKVGAASVIENITISNLQNNILEYCRSYPRLLASLIAAGASFADYTTYLSQQFGATSNKTAQGRICNTAGQSTRSFVEVSMPLMCGVFLNGENLPLSFQSGTGGLRISIQLAPSIQALFGSTAATTTNSFYTLSNVSLTGEYGVPEGGRLPAIKALPFSAFQNFYSVINNGDNTQQTNPALSAVVSQFMNFVPTEHISNYAHDGYKTTPLLNKSTAAGTPQQNLAPIQGVDFIRSGVKFPLQFKIDENNVIRRDVAAPNNDQYAGSTFEAQRQLYFQSALRPLRNTRSCLPGANSEGLSIANGDPHHNSTTGASSGAIPSGFQNCYGVGCRYDAVGNGSTASFAGKPFSVRIQSKLDGGSPMSAYQFYLHRGMLNFDSNGVISVST